MAVSDYDKTVDAGRPVELFEFITGPGTVLRYTSAESDIVYGGNTYAALPIERGKIGARGRADSKEVSVKVPSTSLIAEQFRAHPPARVVAIIIRQGHLRSGDETLDFLAGNEFPVIWTGRVLESRRNDNVTELTCENSEAGLKRVWLRRHYQRACPLDLYGAKCRADKTAARVQTTATPAGNTVTLPQGWHGSFARENFIGGLVEWDGANGREYRTIIGVNGDDLTLSATTAGLQAGDPVDVFLGCPRTLTGCRDLHGNAVNYGGQPFIPSDNPYGRNNYF